MNSKQAVRPAVPASSIQQQIDAAKLLHQLGRVEDAGKKYDEILRQDAGNAEVIGLLAVVVYQRGDLKLAKKLWRRALSNRSPAWVFLRNLHAYLRVLLRDGSPDQAAVLASYEIPEWPLARVPEPVERQMLREAADMLVALGQTDTAVRLVGSVTMSDPTDVRLLYALAKNQMQRGAMGLARTTLARVDEMIQPAFDLQLLVDMHSCAVAVGDRAAADAVSGRLAAAMPVLIAERRPTQTIEVLVLSGKPRIKTAVEALEEFHLDSNFPAQLADVLEDEIHFSFVFEADPAGRAAVDGLPKPDLVINNNANGELVLGDGDLPGLVAFADSFGVPVINHPNKVVLTTRDVSAELIADVPGVRVPKTRRFSAAGKTGEKLGGEIEAQFSYPLIVRTLANQEGKGMDRIDSRADLIKRLSSGIPEEFFVTAFVDSRHQGPFFRKIRAAVVGDEIFVVRVDYDTDWNVHGRKSDERVAFYQSHPELLAAEKGICANPEEELGAAAMQALRGIRDRVPLDIFGVDFDVDAEGALVFFEANATMNLFSTARAEVNHPPEADERLKQAFRGYLASLVAPH